MTDEEKLDHLLKPFSERPDPVDTDKMTQIFLKHIPFLNKLAQILDKMGLSAANMAAYYDMTKGSLKAIKGFQITGAALSLLNFALIPLAFISCKIQGKQFPYSFSKGVKFVYSGALLGLAVLGLVFPGTAFIMGATAGAMALGAGVISIGKHFWDKSQINRQMAELNQELTRTREACSLFENEMNQKLQEAKDKGIDLSSEELNSLLERKQYLQSVLKSQVNRHQELETKKATLGNIALVDKSVGLGLSVLGLLSFAVAIVAPPIGLAGVIAVCTCALGYIGVRAGIAIRDKRRNNKEATDENTTEISQEASENNVEPNNQLENNKQAVASPLQSTMKINMLLKQDPKQLFKNVEEINLLANRAEQLISLVNVKSSKEAALKLMLKMGELIETGRYSKESVLAFVGELQGFKESIPVLKSTLNDIANDTNTLNEGQMNRLRQIPAVDSYLTDKMKDVTSDPGHLEQLIVKNNLSI